MTAPLWQPDDKARQQTNMQSFMDWLAARDIARLSNSDDLYTFSINQTERFWSALKDYAGLKAATWGECILENGSALPGAGWFPDAKLNFAENLLTRRDETDAIVFWGEDKVKRRLSHQDLYSQVAKLAGALKK